MSLGKISLQSKHHLEIYQLAASTNIASFSCIHMAYHTISNHSVIELVEHARVIVSKQMCACPYKAAT
jgi:hypothetical protein